MQRDMRGNYIESIREVESVNRFLQVPVYVVSIDRAAAGRRTRIGLSDQEQLVDGIKLDIGAAELL